MQKEELENLRKQMEDVQIERDEFRVRLENNEREPQINNQLLREVMERMNFQSNLASDFRHRHASLGSRGTMRDHQMEGGENEGLDDPEE